MADNSRENLVSDINILEAALERATERKARSNTMSPPWTPGATPGLRENFNSAVDKLGGGSSQGAQPSSLNRERYGNEVSSYAMQLKTWVDMQVDARMKITLQNVEGELLVTRQESRSALELARLQQESLAKVEQLMLSSDDHSHREMAQLQQETLSSVADLMRTVDELKRSFMHDQRSEMDGLHRLHKEHAESFSEIRGQHEQRIERLRADNASWRAENAEQIRSVQAIQKRELENLEREVRGNVEGQLGSLSNEVRKIQSDLEEMQRLFEKSHRRLGDDLIAHQQNLISELRSETSAALKNEAAAVAALDEQLWVTDQRLGQRVDKVDQLCRESTKRLEDLSLSQNEILRSHKETLSGIKGLALSHRDVTNHNRSPDQATFLERLRSPAPHKASDSPSRSSWAANEDRLVSEKASRGLATSRTADFSRIRSSSYSTRGGSLSARGEGGVAMARKAGEAFAEIGRL